LRRVLVPLDGTPEATAAVRGAVGIAKATGSRLLLLHIIDARPGTARAPASPSYLDQGPYEMEAWREEFLRGSFAMTRAPRSVQTEVALRVGDPGKEIARFAAQRDCDLILAAWSGKLHPGRARVVSTLLQNSPCPLLFLRAP
jgi:nucleotide-binding universal stress UspA family protein